MVEVKLTRCECELIETALRRLQADAQAMATYNLIGDIHDKIRAERIEQGGV